MLRFCHMVCLWLAERCRSRPLEFREYLVKSQDLTTELRRRLLRHIRARLGRERPLWRTGTTL